MENNCIKWKCKHKVQFVIWNIDNFLICKKSFPLVSVYPILSHKYVWPLRDSDVKTRLFKPNCGCMLHHQSRDILKSFT